MRRSVTMGVAVLGVASCALLDPFPELAATPPPSVTGGDAGFVSDARVEHECTPKTEVSCGFEECRGLVRCSDEGRWQPCTVPDASVERCTTTVDESCDGVGACTGDHRWSHAMRPSGDVHVSAIGVSAAGDIYTTGWFTGDLTLPDGTTTQHAGSASLPDAFVMKLARDGKLIWSRHIPDIRFAALSVGKNDLVVSGVVDATTLAGECGSVVRGVGDTIAVARFGFDGKCKVVKAFEGGTSALAAIDPTTDDALVVGLVVAPMSFGGAPGTGADGIAPSSTPEIVSGYVARLGPTLEGKAAATYVSKLLTVQSIAVNRTRQTTIAGTFGGPFMGMKARGTASAYLLQWDERLRTWDADALTTDASDENSVVESIAIAHGPDDRLHGTGAFRGVLSLHPSRGPDLTASGTSVDGYVFVRSTTLPYVVSGASFGLAGDERPHAIAVDSAGGVVVAGSAGGGLVTVGGAPLESATATSFVAKLDGDSVFGWSHTFPSAAGSHGTAVAVGALGDVFVAGDFRQTIDLGGGPIAGNGAFVTMRRP